jgi:hypothetical protein
MAKFPKCPVCQKAGHVRKILWGMPSGDEDLDTYYIGGCVIDENSAKYICLACGLEFGKPRISEIGL